MLRYVFLWFPMLIIAIGNGALREFVIKKYTGEGTAHRLSTAALLIFFTVYIRLVIAEFPPASASQAVWIGILWLMMTLLFEFGFGRWRGNSWKKLFEDYNVVKGRIWILVPLWVAIAPYILYKFSTGAA